MSPYFLRLLLGLKMINESELRLIDLMVCKQLQHTLALTLGRTPGLTGETYCHARALIRASVK